MSIAPDTLIVTGPNFAQESIDLALVTPTGGIQMTLMSALAFGGSVVTTTPGQRILVPLDVATVTNGGTAVTALLAGHKIAGGWIANPVTATVNLGINEIGTASGTTSAGNTTFITPGQTYTLQPSAGAVSVISTDSAHQFSGMGLQ